MTPYRQEHFSTWREATARAGALRMRDTTVKVYVVDMGNTVVVNIEPRRRGWVWHERAQCTNTTPDVQAVDE